MNNLNMYRDVSGIPECALPCPFPQAKCLVPETVLCGLRRLCMAALCFYKPRWTMLNNKIETNTLSRIVTCHVRHEPLPIDQGRQKTTLWPVFATGRNLHISTRDLSRAQQLLMQWLQAPQDASSSWRMVGPPPAALVAWPSQWWVTCMKTLHSHPAPNACSPPRSLA